MKNIVIKAMHGDDDSFYKLIKENQEKLYRIAYSYVKNKEDALDVVQDTVYKAFISIKKLKNPEFFNTWLIRILINSAVSQLNKSKNIIYIEEHQHEDIKSSMKQVEDKIDLHEALDRLDPKYKTIIILKYFEDMTFKDISELLKVSTNTVKTRLYRGLEKLKINFKEAMDGE